MLPNNEYIFHFKSKGEKSGDWYEGSFTVACVLNNLEQMEVAIRTDRYNAGSRTLPEQFKLFNRIMAELELRIKKAPTWWTENNHGWALFDANIVHEIFNKAMEAEKVWSDRLKEKADQAEKTAEKMPAKRAKKEEAVAE
jgi:hypothetical protein